MGEKRGGRADDIEYVKDAVRLAEELRRFDHRATDEWTEEFILRDMRVSSPTHDRPEWFCVVRAYVEGQPVVGFCSGASFEAVLHLVMARIMNGSMKWRDDGDKK